MTELDVIKVKTLRGDMIQALYNLYPTKVPLNRVFELLRYKGYHSKEEIKKATEYLAGIDKEFMDVEPHKDYFKSLVSITPKGINLVEKDIKDIGVILNE